MCSNKTPAISLLGVIALGTLAALAAPALSAGPQNMAGTADGCIVVPLPGGGAKITLVNFVGTHNGKATTYKTAIIVVQAGYVLNCRIPGPGTVGLTSVGDFIGVH